MQNLRREQTNASLAFTASKKHPQLVGLNSASKVEMEGSLKHWGR